MSKLVRFDQKIFGESAGTNQFSEFGSLQNGTPTLYSGATIDPTKVQALGSAFAGGWFSAIVGNYSPAIEDFNSICYLFTRQLAYLLQQGIPEWSAGTTYWIGSVCSDSTGNMYKSLRDTNLNHNPTTDSVHAYWKPFNFEMGTHDITASVVTPYTIGLVDNNQVLVVNTNAPLSIVLPAASGSANLNFFVKDATGTADTHNITVVRSGSDKIENVSGNYTCNIAYGKWHFICDGVGWYLLGSEHFDKIYATYLELTGQGVSKQQSIVLTPASGAVGQTLNFNLGNSVVLDLDTGTGAVTLTYANCVAGGSYIIKVIQGAGPRTIVWPANTKWSYGYAPPISTTNNAVDIVGFYFDGTNYYTSLNQSFA